LDNLMQGGLPESSPVLVSGPPGAGKTVLGLQFLFDGMKKGEAGIYITFEEPKDSIVADGENFGWNFADYIAQRKFVVMEYFELGNEAYLTEMDKLKRALKELEEKKKEIRIKPDYSDELELRMADYQNRIHQIEETVTQRRYSLTQHEREEEFMDRLRDLVRSMDAKRLVIDSLSAYTIYDESRESLHRFVRKVRDLKTTTLLISELPKGSEWLSRDGISEFVCDGIIILSSERVKDKTFRKIRVEKMRHTKIDRGEKFLNFTDKGLDVSESPQES
jgi:KaiC/GvpD/RAD55 family RecA-like ATPase